MNSNICFQFQIPDPSNASESVVFCIHRKKGCKWSDDLRKLKVIPFIYLFL